MRPPLHPCPCCKCGDVDEVAVERACRGDRGVALTGTEMLAAFRWLQAHGRSLTQIAAILGVTPRSVTRWRSGVVPRRRLGRNGAITSRDNGSLTCENGGTNKDGPGRGVSRSGRALTPELARATT